MMFSGPKINAYLAVVSILTLNVVFWTYPEQTIYADEISNE